MTHEHPMIAEMLARKSEGELTDFGVLRNATIDILVDIARKHLPRPGEGEVERVARAIYSVFPENGSDDNAVPWNKLEASFWQQTYRDRAKAAIAAMRPVKVDEQPVQKPPLVTPTNTEMRITDMTGKVHVFDVSHQFVFHPKLERELGSKYLMEIITLLKQESAHPTLKDKNLRKYVHTMCKLALCNTTRVEDGAPVPKITWYEQGEG